MSTKSEQYEKYRAFVRERLEADYSEMLKVVNSIVEEMKEYETLLLIIDKIKVLDPEEPLEMQMNIGKNIFCEAVVEKRDHVIVKLIDDLYAELTLERAEVGVFFFFEH
ncbi:unnamed protein product [Gongylonema pulchrum]|uniref:DH domain-containing protein n=1 Tax=Gongylonema pulchrum TaxID=637853 RepID=A0A183E2Q1_9BILA|nr:unnamed protein product [Gongylonema pulchrum]